MLVHRPVKHTVAFWAIVIRIENNDLKEDLCRQPMTELPIPTLTAEAEMKDGLFMIQIILTAAVQKEGPAGSDGSKLSGATVVRESVSGPAFARMMSN